MSELLFFVATAHAVPSTGTCGTADAIATLQGSAPAAHPGMAAPPAAIGAHGSPPPPGSKKAVYGSVYEFHLETANFTINWSDPRVSEAAATAAAAALETSWTAFLDEQGWPAPVSSDDYYLWVLLDPTLGGTTGYTTEYVTDDFPEGYPVLYLNPDYAHSEAFWASLAAHEFMHAIQFGMRDWSAGDGTEQTWYWEASATHASELAEPSWDGHQYISAWYADQPELPYDSYQGSHQYGMFVLNTWLDEAAAGTMQAVWRAGTARPADTWDTMIAAATGLSPGEIWGGFTGQYGNNALAESHLFADVAIQGPLEDGVGGAPGYLGSHYWRVQQDALVTVASGDVVLGGVGGVSESSLIVYSGDHLAVTALSEGTAYALALSAPPAEDTGTGEDTGAGEDTGTGEDTGMGALAEGSGCAGCRVTPGGGWPLTWLAMPLLWGRRRR